MTDPLAKPRAMGRPTLEPSELGSIFGELSQLTPKTPAYRAKRRELAVRFDRTEHGIEVIFRRMRDKFLAKEKGHGPDKPMPPASSTPKGVATERTSNGPDPSKEV